MSAVGRLTFLLLSSFFISGSLTQPQFAVRSTRYAPVYDIVSGIAACGVDPADMSTVVQVLHQCTVLCGRDAGCAAFNYRTDNVTSPLCERFATSQRSCYTANGNCSYYQAVSDSWTATIYVNASDILMQQHYNGSAAFDRTWAEFKAGFGSTTGDYWLGNDRLHSITSTGQYKLRVDLLSKFNGLWYWAEYSSFIVDDESTNYVLHISGYTGTTNDGFTTPDARNVNGMKFTTKDRDNDLYSGNCANWADVVGGFWYNACAFGYVNGGPGGSTGCIWWPLPIGAAWNATTRYLSATRLRLLRK